MPIVLRCHGMLYEGTIKDLVAPLSVKGPWALNNPEKSTQPVIPCLTCHKVHREGVPAIPANPSDPKKIFYDRKVDLPKALFYYRYKKLTSKLPTCLRQQYGTVPGRLRFRTIPFSVSVCSATLPAPFTRREQVMIERHAAFTKGSAAWHATTIIATTQNRAARIVTLPYRTASSM